jgi:hypothetical protein
MQRQSHYESETNRKHWMHTDACAGVPTLEEIEAERQAAARRVEVRRRARRALRDAGIEGVEVR